MLCFLSASHCCVAARQTDVQCCLSASHRAQLPITPPCCAACRPVTWRCCPSYSRAVLPAVVLCCLSASHQALLPIIPPCCAACRRAMLCYLSADVRAVVLHLASHLVVSCCHSSCCYVIRRAEPPCSTGRRTCRHAGLQLSVVLPVGQLPSYCTTTV